MTKGVGMTERTQEDEITATLHSIAVEWCSAKFAGQMVSVNPQVPIDLFGSRHSYGSVVIPA